MFGGVLVEAFRKAIERRGVGGDEGDVKAFDKAAADRPYRDHGPGLGIPVFEPRILSDQCGSEQPFRYRLEKTVWEVLMSGLQGFMDKYCHE